MKKSLMKKSLAPVFLIIGFLSFDLSAMAQTHYEPYTFTTLAGSSTAGTADGSGAAAQFQAPSGLAVDTGGTIYVADTENNTIRKVTQSGAVTTFAGSPGVAGSADGKGSAARFSSPSGIAVDASGNVYVTDSNNSTIRKITPDATVSTLAGSPGASGSADGTGSAARFRYLGHLAIDNSGNLIVADYGNQTIRKVTPGGVVTTLAGSPGVQGSTNGPAKQALFKYPRGVAVDSTGVIYVSDEQNNTIRKIATDGTVSTLAGTANSQGGSNDGTGPAAQFQSPEGIAVDKAGNVYVADSNNALIRKVTPGGVVTTLAGVPNTSGTNDGTGSGALFSTPYGMATDSFGTLYVGDCFGNNAIRVGKPGSGPPPSGLSPTTFTVNGSSSPSALPADAPIVFEANQTDTNDQVIVRVQSTTTPDKEGSWTDLNTGFSGHMVFDVHDNNYVLTTENYPIGSNIFFRAISQASGRKPDSVSNAIGGFNITSNKAHLPPIDFEIEGMTERFLVFIAAYPLSFNATIDSPASGLSVRLQTSTTPEVESSWTDLNDGNNGGLTSLGNGAFQLNTGKYPSGSGIYFRVVAAASGFADSISNFVGPFDLTQNVLPTVTITSPSPNNGNGTDSSPIQISAADAKTLAFSATATDSDGAIRSIELYVDASLEVSRPNSPADAGIPQTQGKHTLAAVATDNVGGKSVAELVIEVAPPAATAKTYAMTQSGDWNNPGNWTAKDGSNGVPGPLDTASLGDFTASIGSGVHITVASLSGGSLSGTDQSSIVTVTNTFTWTGGTIATATLEIASGAKGEIKAIFAGPDFNLNSAAVKNDVGGTITVDVDSFLNSAVAIHGKTTGSSLNNAGTISFQSPSLLDQTTNPFLVAIVQKQASKKLQGLAAITNSGTCYLNGVVIDLSSTSAGDAHMRADSAPTGFIQAGGVLDFGPLNQAGTIIGDVVVNGGTITGSGAIIGNLTNNSGLIAPGHSAGILSVTGNYTQGANGTLLLEVGGNNANGPEYDQLQIGGTANLGGTLDVNAINGYTPASSDTFVPISYSSSTGNFSTTTSNAALTLGATGATLSVTGPNAPGGQPLNIATRLQIQSGDNVLIAGFIITGPAGSTKKVLIRGIGPSLANFGVAGTIPDPFLELHKPDGSVVSNDNWQEAANSGEIPGGFAPGNALESALYLELAPGNYTAVLKGAHGETGIGLAEVYDFETGSTAKLSNIATRGFVNTGDNVMIGGFIIGGSEPAKVLVRAIAPSLAAFLPGVLEATTLELHDSNGSVISNDGWRSTQESEIIATTIPPSDDRESAILATLAPGNYTAVVRGKNDTTGIAVVEAYNLQ
jgi:sugar lactone lactonase YvrE